MDRHDWWTAPADADNGRLIMVTGRRDVEKFRSDPHFNIRMEVSMAYDCDSSGMPSAVDSALIGEATELLAAEFERDPVAVLTGIYTGDGRRDWIFYTRSLHIFGKKINAALAPLPQLPLQVEAYSDPSWEEYSMMMSLEVN